MLGKIVKGIAGFYYVRGEDGKLYECKAKGLFRKDSLKPLVGDNAELMPVTDTEKPDSGSIIRILPRTNELIRPAAANIDQVLVIFSVRRPDLSLNLLDRFLLRMEKLDIPPVIVFSKADLAGEEEKEHLRAVYAASGYPVLFLSVRTGEGLTELKERIGGRVSVLAGCSGVGKSTLVNLLSPDAEMETGEISRKIRRGRNTTRHAELFAGPDGAFLMDTPGFSSLEVEDVPEEKLRLHFPEMVPFEGTCRFDGCLHDREPDCRVKEAVKAGRIAVERYQNYVEFLHELKARKKY